MLLDIGGFDPQFRTAGDDVDVCWQLQEQGHTLGFSPGAMVWHHHRNSVRAYWRQQQGYGQAEAMLELKWPERYNIFGHVTWSGRLYGRGLTLPIFGIRRVYQGMWGLAPFQTLAEASPGTLRALPLMPEWYLVIAVLGILSLGGVAWHPLLAVLPLFALSVTAAMTQAWISARRTTLSGRPRWWVVSFAAKVTVAFLHLVQPLARLRGRLRYGLTLWRKRGHNAMSWPIPRTFPIFVGRWRPPEQQLAALQSAMRAAGAVVWRGGPYDAWDLHVRGGIFGSSRLLMAFEDSGSGTQLARLRLWPHCPSVVFALIVIFGSFSVLAAFNRAPVTAAALGLLAVVLAWRAVRECAITAGTVKQAVIACGLAQSHRATSDEATSTAFDAEHDGRRVLKAEQEQA
jgi:hypothetical protein